eukprot:gnl/Chilomastix_cuspidata/4578.p2 GENE.gnl/Chilomastix_cuspidata/4578~~gnl/Chilomastix_cuspidata/4578.p2  ORF type:complete len:353 (+),score=179.99 gnl/Chilomastix_cuspidata/4578:349-1407(+)
MEALSIEAIREKLSDLRRDSLTGRFAFTAVELSNGGYKTIDALGAFKSLLCIDLSENELTNETIQDLFSRRFLANLNLSRNRLSRFAPGRGHGARALLPALRRLDLSGNGLPRVPDLQLAPFLEALDVSGNAIDALTGFPALRRLRELDVSHNRIASLDGLPALPVRVLSARGNRLRSLCGLRALAHLTTLAAPDNPVAALDVSPTENPWLAELDVSGGRIEDVGQFRRLRHFKLLRALHARGNPVERACTLAAARGLLLPDEEFPAVANAYTPPPIGCPSMPTEDELFRLHEAASAAAASSRNPFRSVVLCVLPFLQELDGAEVLPSERQRAREWLRPPSGRLLVGTAAFR